MDEDRAWEISTKLEKPGTNEQKGRKQEGDSTIGNNFVWRTCDDQGMVRMLWVMAVTDVAVRVISM